MKKLVFEQGAIGQQQLAAALADDFDGLTHEQLRQRLINGAPKYGNDDDTVDTLLARAYQTYIDELKQYHNPRYGRGPVGGNYYAGTSSISANVPFGAQTMATPDGRKAHTPLAEGASPASGTDHLGPTAVIGSVGKLPTAAILGGVLLNQKLNPATLENESDKQKLMILLRTFFEVHKGWHIQYNIVSRETLLEAKKTSGSIPGSGGACRGLFRLLHRPVTGSSGRYHRPYRTYAVIFSARRRRRRAKSFTSSISSLLSFEI